MGKKLAIITGGSRGVGKAIAFDLAKQGYDLALIARDQDRLDQVKQKIGDQYKVDIGTFSVDVSDFDATKAVVEQIYKAHGRIDLLFNSAGILREGTSETTPDDFDDLIRVNLKGMHNMIHAVVPKLKTQGYGHVFNLASMAGKRGWHGFGAYSLTKFGVVGYSDTLYHELLPYNVKVTVLCPSAIATDMTKESPLPQESMISVDDIVKTINFVLSLGDTACVPEISIRCKQVDLGEL